MSKGAKALVAIVVGAGAVASAIGAILALRPEPTPELRAELSNLFVDPNVTLDEYAQRHQAAAAPRPPASRDVRLAASGSSDTTTGETSTGETSTDGTTDETTTDETTTDETTTDETTTDETGGGTTTNDDGELRFVLDEEARRRLDEGVDRVLNDPMLPSFDLGDACDAGLDGEDCGLKTHVVYMQVVDAEGAPREVSAEVIAEQLGKLLAGTRTRPEGSGDVQPVGVTVNFNVSLTGFRGRKVAVRWSLYGVDGAPVPRGWLRSQPALWLIGEAEKDTASDDFWVPLPKGEGRFYVRVAVVDEDGHRLDFRNTGPFG
ncbi:MAG TPA: hypothetical protein VFL41_05825 [Gaiellaceae bacterium]|nr:hypothetical protein [Gaiellaceae bacterium]HET8652590.1 hypothetical protein [Gaiellaceae bacterium]